MPESGHPVNHLGRIYGQCRKKVAAIPAWLTDRNAEQSLCRNEEIEIAVLFDFWIKLSVIDQHRLHRLDRRKRKPLDLAPDLVLHRNPNPNFPLDLNHVCASWQLYEQVNLNARAGLPRRVTW